jgi:phosphoglycerate dehydrogenase-like enzyme
MVSDAAHDVSIHLALTDATRRMIGERELGLMKPAACLVNTARGAIVDEAALHRMLTSGYVRGAALDVFSEEPPRSNPLVGLAQVIASPHLGGTQVKASVGRATRLTDSLLLLLDGAPPTRLVNPEVWPPYVERWGR